MRGSRHVDGLFFRKTASRTFGELLMPDSFKSIALDEDSFLEEVCFFPRIRIEYSSVKASEHNFCISEIR